MRGRDLRWFPLGLIAVAMLAWSMQAGGALAQNNSCQFANDGECDESRYYGNITGACPAGTDTYDCRALRLRPQSEMAGNSCQWAFDGECDEGRYVGSVTTVCADGTDTADCTGLSLRSPAEMAGNSCQWAFDGECDHPGIGTGACPMGTDASDCAGQGTRTEADSCRWAFDGECDESRYAGTGACRAGTDTTDCEPLAMGGNDSCRWAFDGECDENGIGTGVCADGTDRTDCAAVAHMRNRDNSCRTSFDNRCDEPDGGSGRCEPRTDTVDCLGRITAPGIRDHYFGQDDRQVVDASRYPWSAIGEVHFRGGGSCTAALVAPNVAVTAAHCFFTDGRPDSATEFLAGRHGDGHVARANVIRHFVPPAYDEQRHAETNEINNLDWAFFVLDRPIGRTAGTLGVHPVTEADLEQAVRGTWYRVSQAGYSWDAPDRMTGHIGCRIIGAQDDSTIFHECDTTLGDSGSPIFIEKDGGYYIIAVDSQFFENPKGESRYLAVDTRAFADALGKFLQGL